MKAHLFTYSFTFLLMLTAAACNKKDDRTPVNNTDAALEKACGNPFRQPYDTTFYVLPTAFTPNGDGKNDLYWIQGIHPPFTGFTMAIYRTTGSKVIQIKSVDTYWDGRDSLGQMCTDYKYFVKLKYSDGSRLVDTGTYVYMLSGNTCVKRVVADTLKYHFADQFDLSKGSFQYPTNEVFCN